MSKDSNAKPYLFQIKKWKIRNMVMLYLEAREKLKDYRRILKRGAFISFERLRELSDILFDIKEDHHLLYKRLIDPQKNKFENANKFTPDKVEIDFMNNLGLLFHKVKVALELKYVMEHYVEKSETFQLSKDNLDDHLEKIDALLDEGIETLKLLIKKNNEKLLLLSFLLEEPKRTMKHFGASAQKIIALFGDGNGSEDVYYKVGKYYVDCGWNEKAKEMFEFVLKKNASHELAKTGLSGLN